MTDDGLNIDERRQKLADTFGRELDPLKRYHERFESAGVDPFELFFEESLNPDNPDESTQGNWERTFKQWRSYMADQGRHPACPNETHVKGFIRHLRANHEDGGRNNNASTVKQKLHRLNRIFEYWQNEAEFPHERDYNPIRTARQKVSISEPDKKELPRIPLNEMRGIVGNVTHYRSRALVAVQLKLGLRQGEVSNIQLQDLHISNPELQRHFPNLGSHRRLKGHQDALYVPGRDERNGNKSERPRLLPLDDELRHVLLRYLLVRPHNGEPWLFLTLKTHGKITDNATINDIWREAFHPEYAETEEHRGVTSHFGRHWFTTFWRVKQDVNRELIKYMRGDTAGSRNIEKRGAIDEYIHTYYEDIETLYRKNIFKLGI